MSHLATNRDTALRLLKSKRALVSPLSGPAMADVTLDVATDDLKS